jgi:hypothetical protein
VLWQEAQIARERVNQRLATETLLLDAVVTKALSSDRSGFENLQSILKGLRNGC